MLELLCQYVNCFLWICGIFKHDFVFSRICKEFEIIKDRAVKVPETTEDMTAMIAYIEHVKTKEIKELNNRIIVGISGSHAHAYFCMFTSMCSSVNNN